MVGVGRQAKGRPSLPLRHRQWYCALSRLQKFTQSTGQIKMDIGSSLACNQFCFMLPNDSTVPIMHHHGFIGLIGKKPSVKADLAT